MTLLKKRHTPGSAAGGYDWADESTMLDIPPDIANKLLHIGDEFIEVLPTDPEHPDYVEPEPEPVEIGDGDVPYAPAEITEPGQQAEITEPAPPAAAPILEKTKPPATQK